MAEAQLQLLMIGLGAAGLALLAAGVALGWGPLVGWGIAALGGEYAVLISAAGNSFDEAAPIYAACLLVVAELAFWSIERRVAAWTDSWLLVRRLAYVGGASAAAAVVAGAVLVIAAASPGGGIAVEGLGVVAAVGVLATVAYLARSGPVR